jgi:hypothetical protein
MLGDQIDHEHGVDHNEGAKEVDEHALARQLRVLSGREREERFLGDAHESGRHAHDKNGKTPELVVREVPAAQAVAQLREQERHKAHDPLQAEQDDGGEAHPRVQRVHVGYGLGGQVVRVEHGLESDDCEHEHGHLDHCVQDLHVQLGGSSKQSIDEHGLTK